MEPEMSTYTKAGSRRRIDVILIHKERVPVERIGCRFGLFPHQILLFEWQFRDCKLVKLGLLLCRCGEYMEDTPLQCFAIRVLQGFEG